MNSIKKNHALFELNMDPVEYAKGFMRFPKEDRELFPLVFQGIQDYGVGVRSLNSIGVFNLGANFTTAMAVRGLLRPHGRVEQLEHTTKDFLFMASLLGFEKIYRGDGDQHFYTLEPFELYEDMINRLGNQLGGSRYHFWNTLESTRDVTRAMMGNVLAPPEYQYEAVFSFFVGDALSRKKKQFARACHSTLRYCEDFFAMAFLLGAEEYKTPSGLYIPMANLTEEDVQETFENLPEDLPPVKFKIYTTSGVGDIRSESDPHYSRVALVAGRKTKA